MDERSISLSGLARVRVLAGQEILGRPCRHYSTTTDEFEARILGPGLSYEV